MTKISAPGKVILLGEHFSVYGGEALSCAVNLRLFLKIKKRKDKKILIKAFPKEPIIKAINLIERKLSLKKSGWEIEIVSQIPQKKGFGSSGALCASLVYGIVKENKINLSKRKIALLAWEAENIFHGKSSGLDPFCAVYGGVISYKKGKAKKISLEKFPTIYVFDTKKESLTKKIVKEVRMLKKNFPLIFNEILKTGKILVEKGKEFLEKGDFEKFGKIMEINQGLLYSIGVSSKEIEKILWEEKENFLGMKLSGAGKGGIVLGLSFKKPKTKRKPDFILKVDFDGVKIEKEI